MDRESTCVEKLRAALATYGLDRPAESQMLELFRELIGGRHGADPFQRERESGHFTGSAWLVSADSERVLLTHHRKLNRWLQLGGHADGDSDLAAVALREAEEESGLTDLTVEPDIFDLDRHLIPARGDEPEHWHYDVRFVVRAHGSEDFTVGDESHDLAWRSIGELVSDESVDESVRRMAAKWLSCGSGFSRDALSEEHRG
jgi:8-oxo-dGTP pyrophosphatase MutT (NUDIX family)